MIEELVHEYQARLRRRWLTTSTAILRRTCCIGSSVAALVEMSGRSTIPMIVSLRAAHFHPLAYLFQPGSLGSCDPND